MEQQENQNFGLKKNFKKHKKFKKQKNKNKQNYNKKIDLNEYISQQSANISHPAPNKKSLQQIDQNNQKQQQKKPNKDYNNQHKPKKTTSDNQNQQQKKFTDDDKEQKQKQQQKSTDNQQQNKKPTTAPQPQNDIITTPKHSTNSSNKKSRKTKVNIKPQQNFNIQKNILQLEKEQPINLKNFKSIVDKTNRFFPNIVNQDECEKEYKIGVWANNKCWKDPEYAICETTQEETPQCKYNPYSGKYISTKYLQTIPDDLKAISIDDKVDMSDPKFQKRILQYFTGQLSRKMPIYQNPLPTEFVDACNQSSNKSQPTIAQALMNVSAQLMLKFPQSHRGMLCYHSLGSGKSCTASAIMEAYWNTDKKIYYITTFGNLKSVGLQEFMDCIRLFPKFKTLTKEDAEKQFHQRNIQFISFQQAANKLGIGQKIKDSSIDAFKNSLLLIDEVQNIFTPIATQKEGFEQLKQFFLQKNSSHLLNTHIYGLTATPGNTPQQIVQLINMFRGPTQTVLQVPTNDLEFDIFQKEILGMISYVDSRKDFTRFPRVFDDDVNIINMSDKQFQKYKEKLSELKKTYKKETDLPLLQKQNLVEDYYKTLRRYSNMMLNFIGTDTLETYSHKLSAIINKIQDFPNDKQYIYSSFFRDVGDFGGQGIRSIAYGLQKFAGYEQVSLKVFYDACRQKLKLDDFLTPGKKRFLLLLSTEFEKYKIPLQFRNSDAFRHYFNDPLNSHGEYVQLLLTSQRFNEGMDLKDIQHVHIFEPFVQKAADEQAIGRAARSCSHKNLKFPQEWIVQVHRYISDFPSTYKLIDREQFQQVIKDLQKQNNDLQSYIQKLHSHLNQSYLDQQGASTINQDIQTLKLKIKNNENRIGVIQKQIQKTEQEGNFIPIDFEIQRTAYLTYSTLRRIYQIIQHSAIDCILLNKLANYKDSHCYLDQIQTPLPTNNHTVLT